MTMTRDQLVTLTEEVLDAVGSNRFGTTLKQQALTAVHSRGWKRLLGANRHYRYATRSVTTDANGRVTLTSLDSGTGDSKERFYKLLGAAQGTLRYRPINDMDDPLVAGLVGAAMDYAVWKQGDALQFTPVQEGAAITCAVSHLPPRISDLSGGTIAVTWPEDYELILAYEAAAFLVSKAGSEIGASLHFRDQADELWQDLLADVGRFSTEPLVIGASDNADEWGSQ